jgi:hypothetical protein
MNPGTRPPFLTAFLHPLNLGMLFMAVASGLCAAWWMFPLGLVIWAVMYLLVLRHPSLRMSHVMEARTALAQRFQARFYRIERVQIAMFNNLSSANRSHRQALQPVQIEIDRITELSYQLCKRMTALENLRLVDHMKKTRNEADFAEFERKLLAATDEEARKDYEDARRSLQNRMDKMAEISIFLDRVEAQLASLASTLDTVLTDSIRLQTLGIQQVRQGVPELVTLMRQQEQELSVFAAQAAAGF